MVSGNQDFAMITVLSWSLLWEPWAGQRGPGHSRFRTVSHRSLRAVNRRSDTDGDQIWMKSPDGGSGAGQIVADHLPQRVPRAGLLDAQQRPPAVQHQAAQRVAVHRAGQPPQD